MDIFLYQKKLAFTISSVNENNGHVSGIVELNDGSYFYFDNCGITFFNKDGAVVWSRGFDEDDDDDYKDNIRDVVLYGISNANVVRVYPDCC